MGDVKETVKEGACRVIPNRGTINLGFVTLHYDDLHDRVCGKEE